MSARHMVDGLHYGTSGAEFFKLVDKLGGWPVGRKFAGFCHTSEREAGFCDSPHSDGWWTVIASADDYYMWKLSPEAMQRIVDAAISASRVTAVNADGLRIKNSRGYRAELGDAT